MPSRRSSGGARGLDRLTADVLRGVAVGFALGVCYMIALPSERPGPLARELPGYYEQQQQLSRHNEAGAVADADTAVVNAAGGGDDCSACLDSLHDCLSTRHDAAWVEEHDRLRQRENDNLSRDLDVTARELRHLKRDVKAGRAMGCKCSC